MWLRPRLFVAVALGLLSYALPCGAALERYEYDGLGRLVRYIDAQGRVIDYIYDAAGNILQVGAGQAAQAPTVAGIMPTAIRRGTAHALTMTGSGLTRATVTATAMRVARRDTTWQ